uniref:Uncharacterized protein n=1 Tax=Anopheles dirus TaxID=7168 RepID=A0A182NWG7_9DIPT
MILWLVISDRFATLHTPARRGGNSVSVCVRV